MATTIPDITLTSLDWVDVNTASGIAAGTAMTIQNKSPSYILVQEGVTKPDTDSRDGVVASDLRGPWARIDTSASSDTIWMKVANEGRTVKISVQEVS